MMATSVDRVGSVPLFQGLSSAERSTLAAMLKVRRFNANEVIFWIGDLGTDFFIVEEGHVVLSLPDEAGNELELALLEPGSFFGELSLLDGGPRTATARAQTAVTLLGLGRDDFLLFLRNYSSATGHMLKVLGERSRGTLEKLRGVKNENAVVEEQMTRWQRIADAIARMAASRNFLVSHAALFGVWILMNLSLPPKALDPFPFPFLCFWASVEAIFLSLFILISQNVQGQRDRIRADIEYQVNLKAHLEVMQLHQKMDRLEALLLERVEG
jgi:CRP/FNR family cyclic AMP-dependent transcriptional regulator